MSKPKFHIKRGDQVEVISGEHKGSQGAVLQIIPAKSQVLVEGVRMITKAKRKTQTDAGGLVKREGPIHASNVKVVAAKAEEKKSAKKSDKKK